MKADKLLILTAIAMTLANSAFAVDCPIALIDQIQVESNVVYFQAAGNWHSLGDLSAVGTKERYATLLTALATGKNALARFPAGYNCSVDDFITPAIAARIYR